MSTIAPAIGLGAGYGLASSVGGSTITVCDAKNADTFYCKFVLFFNIFKMFIWFIVMIAIIVWLLYNFSGMGQYKGRGKGSLLGRKIKGG